MARQEIVLAGLGGHGILFMGRVLGYAAVLSGRDAVMTTSYSPAQRGGWSKAYIVVSDEAIDYPMVTEPDALVATTTETLLDEIKHVRKGGVVVIDSDIVRGTTRLEGYRVYSVGAHRLAEEKVGNPRTANMVLLGVLVKATKVVEPEYVEQAIKHVTPRKQFIEPNIEAFRIGYSEV